MDSNSLLEYNVDKTQVPAIDQKRIVAFINHFVVKTVTFLNQFAVNCETKFVDFESKLQQIESSLLILESKLQSIPDLDRSSAPIPSISSAAVETSPSAGTDEVDEMTNEDSTNNNENTDADGEAPSSPPVVGVRVCDDDRYKKYFKMVQFGVPAPAVKLKMEAEGLNGSLLDDPNRLVEVVETM